MCGSGWVVAKKAFITAGHCVCGTGLGGWITEAKFEPGFNVTAGKVYNVSTIYSLKGWSEEHDWSYDMAACVVTENFAETEPPLKFHDSIFHPDKFLAIGYPLRPTFNYEFNGKRMWQCVGEFIEEDEGDCWWAVNDLTGGASGGPWCDAFNEANVYGHTSNRSHNPETARTPMLLNGFENLYKAVKDL
jgi:V8-like Glu-specific endopeptidase